MKNGGFLVAKDLAQSLVLNHCGSSPKPTNGNLLPYEDVPHALTRRTLFIPILLIYNPSGHVLETTAISTHVANQTRWWIDRRGSRNLIYCYVTDLEVENGPLIAFNFKRCSSRAVVFPTAPLRRCCLCSMVVDLSSIVIIDKFYPLP